MRPECKFRFPVSNPAQDKEICPKCGSPTQSTEFSQPDDSLPAENQKPYSPEIAVLLDNIRSSFNVGAIFRTADGAGVFHIYLCGITPTPDNPKITKTALGSEYAIPWTQEWNSLEIITKLKESNFTIFALEASQKSTSLFDIGKQLIQHPLLLVVGNEVNGIDPEIFERCDQTIHIPMLGSKKSLNVAVAFGIAVYTLRFAQNSTFLDRK